VPTRIDDAMIMLWEGDAGYEVADAGATGGRHRLTMRDGHASVYERSFD
jgi:hypothetical protein